MPPQSLVTSSLGGVSPLSPLATASLPLIGGIPPPFNQPASSIPTGYGGMMVTSTSGGPPPIYHVVVTTGDAVGDVGPGDGDVSIVIYGEAGNTGVLRLEGEPEDFEPGKVRHGAGKGGKGEGGRVGMGREEGCAKGKDCAAQRKCKSLWARA